MPALVAFGRKWLVGSDDFVYPGFFLLLIRLAWMSVIAAVYSINQPTANGCDAGEWLYNYYVGMLVILPLEVILCSATALISMRGTIMDTRARRSLPTVLYMQLLMLLVETVWNSLASYWVFLQGSDCELEVVMTARVLIVFSWCILFCIIVGIVIFFDALGGRSATHEGRSSRVWRTRCKLLCCAFRSDQNLNSAFGEVSDIVAEFFEDVDLVATDIAVGLGLIYRRQRKDKKNWLSEKEVVEGGCQQEATSAPAVAADFRPEWMNISLATHYMSYALASYGWPMYAYSHLPFGCCGLCCLSHPAPSGYDVMDDRCCFCNLGAIQKTVDLSRATVVHVSFSNELYENPFFIAIDHTEKSVVVAIRGTLSVKDAVVDVNAMGDVIGTLQDSSCQAHQGMLRSAVRLKETMENRGFLRSLFAGEAAGYQLVLCGHSLGAGVAALLAILMKSDYPDLRCYAFSPPGGLLSPSARKKTKDWIMSVVVGDDLVPRLSMRTMTDLKAAIIEALNQVRKPKYRLFAAGCWHVLFGSCSRGTAPDSDVILDAEEPLAPEGGRSYRSFAPYSMAQPVSAYGTVSTEDVPAMSFGLPGYVLFIGDRVDVRSNTKTGHFTKWLPAEAFDALVVSGNMGYDHMPNVVLKTLSRINTYGCTTQQII